MNILLVRPKPHKDTIGLQSIMVCEPLELEYLAATIRGDHQVDLVDMILEKKPFEYYIRLFKPRAVGLTAYISHINEVKNYAKTIKEIDPDIFVIIGGVHADVVPQDFLDENVDYIISGNGMESFRRLIDNIEKNQQVLTEKIIKGTGETEIPPCFPDRKITENYRHRYYYIYHKPCALLKTSYGCPFTCSFCFCRQITKGKYVERDLDSVIEELKLIPEREVYIVDDNFLVDPRRVDRFCDLLKKHGIKKKFLIYGRADFIVHHQVIMAKFADIGLRAVIVGVESPNPKELEQYDKKSSVEINEEAIKILGKLGIDCYATMILGIDWDDHDFRQLYLWLKKQKLRFVNLQPLTPLPGTPLFDRYKELLTVPRESFEQWDLANLVIKPTKISLKRYYFNILKVYFLISLSPGSIGKNLKYGLAPNFKLLLGVLRITWQYAKKII